MHAALDSSVRFIVLCSSRLLTGSAKQHHLFSGVAEPLRLTSQGLASAMKEDMKAVIDLLFQAFACRSTEKLGGVGKCMIDPNARDWTSSTYVSTFVLLDARTKTICIKHENPDQPQHAQVQADSHTSTTSNKMLREVYNRSNHPYNSPRYDA